MLETLVSMGQIRRAPPGGEKIKKIDFEKVARFRMTGIGKRHWFAYDFKILIKSESSILILNMTQFLLLGSWRWHCEFHSAQAVSISCEVSVILVGLDLAFTLAD